MRMQWIAWLGVCVALGGCERITAGLTPATEKVNKAFPLADDLQTAHNALMSSLEGDKSAQQTIAEQYNKLMTVRALTCTAKTPIGRFDTIPGIRGKVSDTDCFQKQDVRLAEWVAWRRLGLVMAKPPLTPLMDLPAKALLPNFTDYSGPVAVAAAANVMVARGPQKFSVVQIPSGKQISSFAAPDQSYRPPVLSSNGRVLAIPVGSRNLRIVEVETGNVLWNTEDYADLLAWLPQLEAAVLTQTNTGAPQLLDIRNGKISDYPSAEKRMTWALPTPLADGKYLVGSGQTASLMQVTRSAEGALDAAPVKQWRLNGYGASGAPLLMDNGKKIVYLSSQDLNWLDVQTEQQGSWQLSALNAYGFAKLNEQAVLFDSMSITPGQAGTPVTRVLDITQGTVAVAKNLDGRDGNLVSLAPRSGYLKRNGTGVTIGSAVELDTPQALDPLVSEALLAKQLARLNAMSANAEMQAQLQAQSPADRERYLDNLARQMRAMNGSVAADAAANAAASAAARASGGTLAMLPGTKPMLSDVPANAKVSVIGVYEAASNASAPAMPAGVAASRKAGNIRVTVAPGNTPLVLVLSSYEPVRWTVIPGSRKISAILVSSYYESSVSGQGNAPVVRIGSNYAYKLDSTEYLRLKQDIARYVASPVQVFQGAYKGQDFSVN